MSLHINKFTKERGVGKNLFLTLCAIMRDEHVIIFFAGDLNRATWRQTSANNPHPTRSHVSAFADTDSPMPPVPLTLWGPGAFLGEWADVCGIIVPPNSHVSWKVRLLEFFKIHREILGLSERDQRFHHEVWLHLDLAGDRQVHVSVKGMNPAPHIHEHLRYTIMVTALRTPSRITTSRLSTLR